MDTGARLSCRPPWFETTSPSAPTLRARRASSAVSTPPVSPPACMNRVNPVGAIRVEGAEAHEGFQFGQLG